MLIHQIFAANSLRNFNYILACEETKEAIVIDPLRVDKILELANHKSYNITKIINTHDHHDHTAGNNELIQKTKAIVHCHQMAMHNIPCASVGLQAGDLITAGSSIKLKVLDTPGHTMAHVCLLAHDLASHPKAIFSGDTLFNAGAGNCYSGNIDDLYNTFVKILFKLPDDVLLYPGHDYLENNLNFTLNCEPDNLDAIKLLDLIYKNKNINNNFIATTMATEKKINTFFRLNNSKIINYLNTLNMLDFTQGQFGHDKNSYDKAVFVALRNLRNKW